MELTQATGALVAEVISGSPADDAGLRGATRDYELETGSVIKIGGDVIVAIDGQPIIAFDDLLAFLSRNGEVDKAITLTIIRGGKEQQLELILGARPKQIN
jgi:2-alkenal reductase